jgi:hypothetical protein
MYVIFTVELVYKKWYKDKGHPITCHADVEGE